MLKTKRIEYYDKDTQLVGYYASDEHVQKRPVVLVCPDWSGCNEFAHKKAEQLATLGYIGFAVDIYGAGKLGSNNDEKMALMKPFMDDRALLLQRMMAALDTAKNLPMVDSNKIAVIGFCFGGLCALDLARSGAEIKGVVSFHGLLGESNLKKSPIKAKILVLQGSEDPMVPSEQILAFEKEMSNAKADWQTHVFGQAMHAFMNPLANDPGFGTVYNPIAEKRSWTMMTNFLSEIL